MTNVLSRPHSVLPGFGLALGYTLLYLALIVLIPLSAAFIKTFTLTWDAFWARRHRAARAGVAAAVVRRIARSRPLRSTRCSASSSRGCSCATAFPAAACVDALVDLPFALPTAVAGIALERDLRDERLARRAARARSASRSRYTPLGVLIALMFVGLPFVVRTVQPVLEDMEHELEEAAQIARRDPLADVSRA